MVEIPDVGYQPIPEAVAEIEAAGLVADYDRDRAEPRHLVVGFQENIGEEVEEGTTIWLPVLTVLEYAGGCLLPAAIKAEDDGHTLFLDMAGQDDLMTDGLASYEQVQCVLEGLGAPASVLTLMEQTRSLDGRQEAEWDGIQASWTYHPDNGLDILLTIPDPS